ncbi:hypothetical protein SAMN02927900_03324 [Rhizobium mongolense subsp. loessense]|uniref:Uncharacterized protein n=1 Tax=Rhizobium mongolense subsp. loessense TaxID=158890 RepID=A0A1G4S1Z1_9HYPH|nr:hypothetical protein [Rhizobium mongolense]SCW63100.1 hypothetical protein SAMN02927900_03324 [Rhizobium mongolense subsp. loessense]
MDTSFALVAARGPVSAILAWLIPMIAAAFLVVPTLAHACVLCLPYPQETEADQVIGSGTAVFAGENPVKPFSYVVQETFKGHYDGSAIPLFLDSMTGRALRLNPMLRVILVQNRPGGIWTGLGLAGSEYQGVMRQLADWDAGSKTPAERAMFFAPYLRHEDRRLAELAFLEVGRAPYATLRNLKTNVGRDDIYRIVNDFFHVEWHGLYILMLGTSDRPDDIAFVRAKLKTAAKYRLTTNLAAYATALIEMTGADGVTRLAEEYFVKSGRSNSELLEIVKALSVQGTGGAVELRPSIIDAYERLLAVRPELAGHVANDLLAWKVTRFVPRLREILNTGIGLDEASHFAVATYLSSADDGGSFEAGLTPFDDLR